MSSSQGQKRPGAPGHRSTGSDNKGGRLRTTNRKKSSANPRSGISDIRDLGPSLVTVAVANLAVLASTFLPWSSPPPEQNWFERLLSLGYDMVPSVVGLDLSRGQTAAFTSGVALVLGLVLVMTGAFPKALSIGALVFTLSASYHVLSEFKDVTNGTIWRIENDEVIKASAVENTWETFQIMAQSLYGLLIAVIASLIAVGAALTIVAMAYAGGSVIQVQFVESEWTRLSLRAAPALTVGFILVGSWWWATLVCSLAAGAVWLAAGRRVNDLTIKTAIVPVIAVVGVISALQSFVYR